MSYRPTPPKTCAGSQEFTGMTQTRLRRQVAHTYRTWPTCPEHGCDLEASEQGYRGDVSARLTCPKRWY